MKKTSKVLLTIISSLNIVKFLAYIVFVIMVITNAPYSAAPGWLMHLAFFGLAILAVILIPYACVLFLSILFYVLGLITKRNAFYNTSAIISMVGSVILTAIALWTLGTTMMESPLSTEFITFFVLLIIYLLIETVIALFALISNLKKKNAA